MTFTTQKYFLRALFKTSERPRAQNISLYLILSKTSTNIKNTTSLTQTPFLPPINTRMGKNTKNAHLSHLNPIFSLGTKTIEGASLKLFHFPNVQPEITKLEIPPYFTPPTPSRPLIGVHMAGKWRNYFSVHYP